MGDIYPAKSSMQYFSGTGANTVHFGRTINCLIITVTGTVQVSLDNLNFLTIAAGTHQLSPFPVQILYLQGGGTYEGYGVAV